MTPDRDNVPVAACDADFATDIPAAPQVLWWKSGLIPPLGVYPYWTDPFSLFFIELIAVQFAELKRCEHASRSQSDEITWLWVCRVPRAVR